MARSPRPTSLTTRPAQDLTIQAQIPGLLRSARSLYVATAVLGGNGKDVLSVLRRLMVQQVLADRPTIAVVGSQGAGKTTLVTSLYDLPPKLLEANVGRGEVIPVRLIERADVSEPRCFVLTVEHGGQLNGEVFRDEISGEAMAIRTKAPLRGDLLFELEVPPRHFGGGDTCLLLLPGFEDPEVDWDGTARLAVEGAAACLLAIDPATRADGRTQEHIRRVVGGFRAGRTAIALTKSDTSGDHNAAARSAVLREFNVPDALADRVVCTAATGEQRTSWIPKLAVALSKITPTGRRDEEDKLDLLETLVQDDFGACLTELHEARTRLRSEDFASTLRIGEVLKPFDEAVQKLRVSYSGELRTSFRTRAAEAQRVVERNIEDRDRFEKVWTSLFGVSLADQRRFLEALEAAWDTAKAREEHVKVLASVVAKHLTIQAKTPLAISAYESPQDRQGPFQIPGTELLAALVARPESTPDAPAGTLADAFRRLPAMLLEYARLCEVDPDVFRSEYGRSEADRNGRADQAVKEFMSASQTQRTIFQAIGGLLAIDVAADGKLDSIPRLSAALGFGPPVVSTGGAAVAAGVATPALLAAGALVVTVAAVVTIRQVNKADIESAGIAATAFAGIAESATQGALGQYDEAMARLREALQRRLERAFKIDAAQERLLRCDLALASAGDARASMMEAIRARR